MPTRKQPISADDLYHVEQITDCQLSPDGRAVIYPVQRVDRQREKKYANLWLVTTDGGRPRQFTYGNQVDSQPRWSPDGEQIAFLSNRGNETQSQLYLLPMTGGEARPLTDLQGEFGPFAWSPDGRQIVCQFRKKDPEAVAREADEQKKKLGVVSRRITRLWYKLDGRGYLPNERWQIWTIDTRTGQATQRTASPDHDAVLPCWSPDGQWIAFCSNRSADPDRHFEKVDLWVMPSGSTGSPDGGECRALPTPPGAKSTCSFSPDGRWLAYYGLPGRVGPWENMGLWLVPVDGSRAAHNLTAAFDLSILNLTLTDLYGPSPEVPPLWSPDGSRIYCVLTRHGNVPLYTIPVAEEPGEPTVVIGGAGVVGAYSLDRQQTKLAYFQGTAIEPGQLWLRDLTTGSRGRHSRQLTRINATWLRRRALGVVEEVWWPGPSGADLHGWIIKPPDFDPTRQYPAILQIHGGPHTQYGNWYMHEFHYLAAHGYVVFCCNPRGSQGYGTAHARAVLHNWAEPAYADLMSWTDTLCQQPYIDPNRLGVTGGSYGGYMTNWIIGHTNRFKAAVTKRCVSNLISLHGASDLNWLFQMMYGNDQPPWANLEQYWQQSPLKYIGQAKTPTLVIHSEQDQRCAVEQGEQLFVALKQVGVETELILFPDESHGMSAGGRTDRRIDQLQHTLRWFDRYLKGEKAKIQAA